MKRLILALAVTTATLVVSPMAQAAVIAPGGVQAAPDTQALLAGTLVASGFQNVVSSNVNAQIRYGVYRETSTGNLVFLYQIATNSLDPITRLTGFNFDAYTTDVFNTTSVVGGPFTAGTVVYNVANRTASGGTVGFDYGPTVGGAGVAPGQTSTIMAIRTNAPSFSIGGNIGVTDGTTFNITGFTPTPEPATAVLFGGCFIGLGAFRAWRRRQDTSASS